MFSHLFGQTIINPLKVVWNTCGTSFWKCFLKYANSWHNWRSLYHNYFETSIWIRYLFKISPLSCMHIEFQSKGNKSNMVTFTMIFSIKYVELIWQILNTRSWQSSGFIQICVLYTHNLCKMSDFFHIKKKIHSMLAYLFPKTHEAGTHLSFLFMLTSFWLGFIDIFTSSFSNDQTIQESYLHGQVNIESYVCLIIFIRRLIVLYMYLSGMCITDHIYCIIQDSPVFMCINCICSLSHDKDWAL